MSFVLRKEWLVPERKLLGLGYNEPERVLLELATNFHESSPDRR